MRCSYGETVMFWEVMYIVAGTARVQWRVTVSRKRVADAILSKFPWCIAVKRKHRGELLDITGSDMKSIQAAIALATERQ